jgi:3',5'-cyclic AMP phosphodiesterase CpdA
MRLIHITDPHLSHLQGVQWTQLRGKRWSGFASWIKNRRKKHLPAVLAQLCDAVKSENADQILVTGDLVQIGLDSEIQQAAEWLRALGTPDQVMLVPGNHDVYAKGSETRLNQMWGDFMFAAQQQGQDAPQYWPTLRKQGPLTLIGLSTASVSPLFMATGRLGGRQLQALPVLLKQAREAGQLVAVLIHHPPLPGMTGWRKSLLDNTELQNILADQPPDLLFYGHLHHNRETLLHDARLYCTASASNVQNASYRVIDIQDAGDHFQLQMTLKGIGSSHGDDDQTGAVLVNDNVGNDSASVGKDNSGAAFVTLDSNSWVIKKPAKSKTSQNKNQPE